MGSSGGPLFSAVVKFYIFAKLPTQGLSSTTPYRQYPIARS